MIIDGGPAFARPLSETATDYIPDQIGMSLRDWFAGLALQGLLAADVHDTIASGTVQRSAYNIANAMIEERLNEHN